MCVTGILMAIIERERSGKGQIVDANLVNAMLFAYVKCERRRIYN